MTLDGSDRRELYTRGAVETRAVHAGQFPHEHNGSVAVPIYMTSTFEREVSRQGGWDYSRIANPTRTALEDCVTALEAGDGAVATASGMAAITAAVLAVCRPAAHVLLANNTYGGTWDLFSEILPRWGLDVSMVDFTDHREVRRAIRPETVLFWAETPSNPMIQITDVEELASIAHEHGAVLAVDSTLGSPFLQQPLTLGADIVVHSTTKYLGGHSDVTGGIVVTRQQDLTDRIRNVVNITGAIASPMEAWLVLRGIKTLPARLRQICETSERIAAFLEAHPAVSRVHYPSLADHPQRAVAKKQMTGFGGVVSFEVDGSQADATEVCYATSLFTLAVSLGSVESLIQHPAQMTHCTTTGENAVPDTLIRLSIGLENADELIGDLERALEPMRMRASNLAAARDRVA